MWAGFNYSPYPGDSFLEYQAGPFKGFILRLWRYFDMIPKRDTHPGVAGRWLCFFTILSFPPSTELSVYPEWQQLVEQICFGAQAKPPSWDSLKWHVGIAREQYLLPKFRICSSRSSTDSATSKAFVTTSIKLTFQSLWVRVKMKKVQLKRSLAHTSFLQSCIWKEIECQERKVFWMPPSPLPLTW